MTAAPAAVVQQLVQVSGTLGHGPVEVSLSPEELGRVRMVLSTTDSGMILSITADRDDTLSLLRRHMDMLASDLKNMGLHDLSFRFGSGDAEGRNAGHDGNGRPRQGEGAAPETPASTTTTSRVASGDRLDLRL